MQKFAGRAQLPPTSCEVGTYLSAPVFLDDGNVYGTLCCLTFSPHESVQERDLKNLKSVAMLVAKKVDNAIARCQAINPARSEPVRFTLMPSWFAFDRNAWTSLSAANCANHFATILIATQAYIQREGSQYSYKNVNKR